MSTLRDVMLLKQKTASTKQDKMETTRCLTMGIDYSNSSAVKKKPGYIWVREIAQNGSVFQAFNIAVKEVVGLQVLVRKDPTPPYRRSVIGVDWDAIQSVLQYGGQPYDVKNHAASHEWQDRIPGLDAISIYPRAIAPFRVYPAGSLTYGVAAGWYLYNGVNVHFDTVVSADLTSLLPSAGFLRGLSLYIDMTTNDLVELDGTPGADTDPVTYPSIPTGYNFPLAHVQLYAGQTYLAESDITEDLRPFYSFSGAVSGDISDLETALNNHILYG